MSPLRLCLRLVSRTLVQTVPELYPQHVTMPPYELSGPRPLGRFQTKTQFSAGRDLCLMRNKDWKLPKPENFSENDPWSIKPPDFSLKLYTSVSVHPKKDREFSSKVTGTEQKRRAATFLPSLILQEWKSKKEKTKKKEPPQFRTRFRPPDALETQLTFVRTGKLPSAPYKNPTPPDFRGLDEDLPDIITTYDRDPGHLLLKQKHLDTLRTIRSEADNCLRDSRTRMDTLKPAEPKWDMTLFLPRSPWPPKSASYTRHRRRRGAYSAFLD